jgi:NAD(P)-dependent dehydrogenase (short-subunit alcohol dehydrogenase family)
MPEQPYADRVAVVTGGSRGIGALVARALAEQGHSVVVASRKAEACEAVAAELTAATGNRALGLGFNASSWADCDRLAARVHDELGHVDVLVNNAGMSPTYDSVVDVSEELFDKVVGVNLRGPFRLTALVGTRMKESGRGGSIVNIGSVAAHRPDPGALPYSAAKAGLQALSEGFAQALAPEVRVNTVHPGPVLTDISDAWPDGHREALAGAVALGRCATPEEVVGAVMYLAGDGSSYTTGATLRVDGGWR